MHHTSAQEWDDILLSQQPTVEETVMVDAADENAARSEIGRIYPDCPIVDGPTLEE